MQALNHNLHLGAASILALCLGGYLLTPTVNAADVNDIKKVNGCIRIDAEYRVGNLSSVNGGITIDRGASAYELKTVNGSIKIEDNVTNTEATTVNGGIRLGQGVTVQESLRTVNGGISTENGTVVEDGVETVNGRIELHETRIRSDLQTSNGDIALHDGSVVEADLIVRGNNSWFDRFFNRTQQTTEILIDSSSSVLGDIHLYREVELRIDDEAQVGRIIEHF